MITRRSFLRAAACAAVVPPLALGPAGYGRAEPQGPLDHTQEPVPEGYPYDQPLPGVRREAVTPLPDRVVAGYWTYWGSPLRLTDIPATYNTVFLFHATPVGGAPGTTGAVQWNLPNDGRGAATHFRADLAAFRRTRTAILTVGGARAHVDLSTRARAQVFLDSIRRIHGELGGFDGLDWNNYEGEQQPSTEQMIWISQQLKDAYGQDFAITSPPAPWRPADVRHCRAMIDAGVLDMVSPQYYSSPRLAAEGYIVASVDEWVARMGDARRVGVGFGLGNRAGYSTSAAVGGAWTALAARHPTLRGAFNWDLPTDERLGWPFARDIAPRVAVGAPAPPLVVPPIIPLRGPRSSDTQPGAAAVTPPAVDPATPAADGGARLPDPVRGVRWFPASGLRLNTLDPDFNVVWISAADVPGGGDGTGYGLDDEVRRAMVKADLAELRRRTDPPRIILSGRSGVDGLDGPPRRADSIAAARVDEYAADLIGIATEYGLDGLEWDLEDTPLPTAADLERASRAIVAAMRRADPAFSLMVTTPPGRDGHAAEGTGRLHADVVRRCRDIIDLLQVQYLQPEARRPDLGHVRSEVQAWLDCGLRQDQVGLLWEGTPPEEAPGGERTVPMADAVRVGEALSMTWPHLHGVGTRAMCTDHADGAYPA